MITNTQNINFRDNKIDLAETPIINTQGIISVNNVENRVCATNEFELLNTNDKYWDMLPDELVEKVFTYLDTRSLFACRASCHRNRRVIESIPCGFQIKRNISLFAKAHTDNISINFMVNDFIVFIEKNKLVSKQELPKIKFLLKHFKYSGMQYVLAKINQNVTYSLKTIGVIHQNMFTSYEIVHVMLIRNLIINENNNTYLYATNNILYELKTEGNKVFISKKIRDATKLNSMNHSLFTIKLFAYKNNIVISYNDFKHGTIFLYKINDHYYNITPENLKNVNSIFIGMQTDSQGNNIFILNRNNSVVCYYMPNNSNLNATNVMDYNCKYIKISDENFCVCKVKISKTNNLIIAYGNNYNLNTGKTLEAHIYKNNIKIYTYYFKKIIGFYTNDANNFYCSPKGNNFAIIEKNDNKEKCFTFYQVNNNQVKEIRIFKTNSCHYATENIIYNNTGDMLFIPKNFVSLDYKADTNSKLLYFTAEDSIKKFSIPQSDSYGFNKSGCMFLQVIDDTVTIYNFQNKNCCKTLKINCEKGVIQAEFSPNSQLVVTIEKHQFFNTLNVYKIMNLDANNNLKMLSEAECIGKRTVSSATLFKFHPNGTKLMVNTTYQIEILALTP